MKRVYVQGDAALSRRARQDLGQWYVRSSNGEMAPFSAFATRGWAHCAEQPDALQRRPRLRVPGPGGAGRQLGRGDGRDGRLAAQIPGTERRLGRARPIRSGCRRARRRCSTPLSLLVVFLCLAALYESWSIPVAVLLVIPLGLVGAVFAVTLRGLENDVYPADRPAHHHGPGRQERDPDDRVRRAGGEEGHAGHRRRARSRAHPPAADPDDQLRLHLRRAAAGALDRRRAPTAASPSAPR